MNSRQHQCTTWFFPVKRGNVRKPRMVPKPGFGQALYDLLNHRRRSDGKAWLAEDLAEELQKLRIKGSAKQIRGWIKGDATPMADALIAIADVFQVQAHDLWRGVITPRPTTDGDGSGGAHPDVDLAHRVAQGKRQRSAVQFPKPGKPGHRRSG